MKEQDKKDIYIAVALDESSSMTHNLQETIDGLNDFIKERQEESKDRSIFLTLVKFNSKYDVVHAAVPINEVPLLTKSTYVPSGMTALYDAIAYTVSSTTQRIERNKNAEVLLIVITDGEENSSQEFPGSTGLAKIRELLDDKQKNEDWGVVYLGAAASTWKDAGGMSFSAANTIQYDAASKSAVADTYRSLSRNTKSFVESGGRRGKKDFWNAAQERQIQMGDDNSVGFRLISERDKKIKEMNKKAKDMSIGKCDGCDCTCDSSETPDKESSDG